MTTWGFVILIAAVYFGLKKPDNAPYRYASVFAVVVVMVIYAAMRQHAY